MNHTHSNDDVKIAATPESELPKRASAWTFRKWIRRCFIAILVVFTLLLLVYGSMLFGPEALKVDITVSVVDAITSAPIPNARIVVYTESYGVFDNSQLNFVDTADEKGQLSFHQSIGYAIKSVTVVAYDDQLKKRGVESHVTYAAFPVTGPSSKPGRYILLNPNRRHYRVEVAANEAAEHFSYKELYEDAVQTAKTARTVLPMRGIEVGK